MYFVCVMLDITFIGNSNSGYLYLLILWCVLNISHFGGKNQKPIENRIKLEKNIGKIAKVIGEAHIFFFATENDTEKLTNMSTQTRNGTNAIRFSEKS